MRDQAVPRGLLEKHGKTGLERAHGIGAQQDRSREDNQPVHQALGKEGIGKGGTAFAIQRVHPEIPERLQVPDQIGRQREGHIRVVKRLDALRGRSACEHHDGNFPS